MPKKTWEDYLRFYPEEPTNWTTIKRHYGKWRELQGVPPRCDNEACFFHTHPLIWNGEPLPLIMDHINGQKRDNRPDKLRLLCPNCDSQLNTKGGGNVGKVEDIAPNAYAVLTDDGKKHFTYVPTGGGMKLGGSAKAGVKPNPPDDPVEF